MATREHLRIIKQGVGAWNEWRGRNPRIQPKLEGAGLKGISLENVDLSNAFLGGAFLQRANLEGACLVCAQLEGAILQNANLRKSNLARTDLSSASLRRANLRGACLIGANLSHADLKFADLTGADLTGADLEGSRLNGTIFENATLTEANLRNADLREKRLVDVTLDRSNLTGCILWESQRTGWSIRGVVCDHVFWDRAGKERTEYTPGEFERLHSEGVRVELLYDGGISSAEISSLPFLLRHLEEAHEDCTLRFKSIEDAPSGARVTFIVDETGGADAYALKAKLEEEGRRCQAALRTLSHERQSKQQLEEEYTKLKERIFPLLLEVAERSLLPDGSKTFQAAILFSDLTGFSKLGDDDRAGTLGLLRGMLKPLLSRWNGDYPNMWGDALRVTFEDVNEALECACRVQAVVTSQGFTQRIGMDQGTITARFNATIDGMDIDGDAINMAARLEPLALPGEVLISENLRYHPDVNEERFDLTERTVKLKKAVGDLPADAEITCFVVALR